MDDVEIQRHGYDLADSLARLPLGNALNVAVSMCLRVLDRAPDQIRAELTVMACQSLISGMSGQRPPPGWGQ